MERGREDDMKEGQGKERGRLVKERLLVSQGKVPLPPSFSLLWLWCPLAVQGQEDSILQL